MMDWLLFGLFAGLMFAGVPLAVAMGLAGVAVVAAADLGMLSLPPMFTPASPRIR